MQVYACVKGGCVSLRDRVGVHVCSVFKVYIMSVSSFWRRGERALDPAAARYCHLWGLTSSHGELEIQPGDKTNYKVLRGLFPFDSSLNNWASII